MLTDSYVSSSLCPSIYTQRHTEKTKAGTETPLFLSQSGDYVSCDVRLEATRERDYASWSSNDA